MPQTLVDKIWQQHVITELGGIFYQNCFQNGVLPIVLPRDQVEMLASESLETADGEEMLTVDLQTCTITTPLGQTIPFEINALRREALLRGLDTIGMTLQHNQDITAFQARDRHTRPWVYAIAR